MITKRIFRCPVCGNDVFISVRSPYYDLKSEGNPNNAILHYGCTKCGLILVFDKPLVKKSLDELESFNREKDRIDSIYGSGGTTQTEPELASLDGIENERVRQLAKKCLINVVSWGYKLPRYIRWEEKDSSDWLGITNFDSLTIILNKKLYKQTDIMIQITIYHELAHLIAGSKAGHGNAWKKITDDFHEKTGFIFREYAPARI